jgi:hypothetical protein
VRQDRIQYSYWGVLPSAEVMAWEGFEPTSSFTLVHAIRRILQVSYSGIPLPAAPIKLFTPTKHNRNREIYNRYLAGERAIELAADCGISLQRFHEIIRNERNAT